MSNFAHSNIQVLMSILFFSFIAAYLILFYAIVSRLNTGLDRARSINVRGIMTVAAVLLLGWPILLAQLATTGVFASWGKSIPMMWLAMAAPLILGIAVVFFPVMQQAGKQLNRRDFVWPLSGHFVLSAAYYSLSSLEKTTDSINSWIFFAGLHFFMGIIIIGLYLIKNNSRSVFFRLWHLLGLILSAAGIILIAMEIPRHIISNAGLSRFDTTIAALPMIWLPAMLLPAYFTIHLWGIVQISASDSSKTV